MMDFKIVRRFELKHICLSNQYCLGSFCSPASLLGTILLATANDSDFLFKIKSNGVQTTFVKHLWSFIVTHIYLLFPNSPNISSEVTIQLPFFSFPVVRKIVRNKESSKQNNLKHYCFERWMCFCSNHRTILKSTVLFWGYCRRNWSPSSLKC